MRSAFRRTVRTIDSHTEGNATGKLPLGKTLRFEGVLGTCFTGTLDGDDPLPHGFRIGPPPREAPRPAK